jgi:hypothetical protein
MKKLNLMLHCGGVEITRDDIRGVTTPEPAGRWVPISHDNLLTLVTDSIVGMGMHVVHESFAVTRGGDRMFGLMQVANGHNSDDYSWVCGIRNSHDKTFPAQLCVGSGVFVCDNLAFSSEIVIGRRHTTFINRDLPLLVGKAIGLLSDKWNDQDNRIKSYRESELSNKDAAWLLLQAMRQQVFNKTKIDDIVGDWLKPRYPDTEPRNLWSLFNCVTEHLKPRQGSKGHSLWDLPDRTTRLHALCDSYAGLVTKNVPAIDV